MLIEDQVLTMKYGNVTVKVSTLSLVKVTNICTNECEDKIIIIKVNIVEIGRKKKTSKEWNIE